MSRTLSGSGPAPGTRLRACPRGHRVTPQNRESTLLIPFTLSTLGAYLLCAGECP